MSAETTSIPACFDAEKLDPVSLDRIAFWDQTHKKQRVGFAKPQGGTIVQFPRNPETGELDLENGEYLDPPEETNLKYPSECRLCCGVWLNGRMRMFNYNGMTILGIGEWDAQVASEIVRVKGMANTDAEVGKWVEKD